ncbi:MAG: acetyl-coenzyme A synthetase, partial [Planctomycetaceae bacterium]|nr:acetyl-coenzyme A synthetase [Planctomycetaceae bacterium]
MSENSNAIQSVLHETRTFPPSEEFSKHAIISSEEQYEQMWNRAKDDPAGFWGDIAQTELDWFKMYDS